MKKGMFISFEGGEGCGKSTHIKLLEKYFNEKGFDCVLTREPGGTIISEMIREILLDSKKSNAMNARTELLLFAAARAQLVEEIIKPSIEKNKVVISDRFYDSTIAYQGAARNLDMNNVKFINDFAVSNTMPNLTIVLDIPVEEGLKRAAKRDCNNTDRMGSQKIEFYEKVRESFLDMAKKNPKRFEIVDALKSKEETFDSIKAIIEKKFFNE